MKSVAIVGFAKETLGGAYTTQADEIWVMNNAGILLAKPYEQYPQGLPHIDRCFEIHPLSFIFGSTQYKQEYWDWLAAPHPFPIYVQETDPRIVSGVKYPFDEVSEDIFQRFLRGDEVNLYYTCSLSYMTALAIYEKFDRIEYHGIEMGTNTEYRYQKAGGEFITGVAVGRGIEFILPEKTQLCRGLLYGYEALHMITRQRLEAWRLAFYRAQAEVIGEANVIAGQLSNMKKNVNESAPEYQELLARGQQAQASVFAYGGAVKCVEKLMLECDQVPSTSEIELNVKTLEIV